MNYDCEFMNKDDWYCNQLWYIKLYRWLKWKPVYAVGAIIFYAKFPHEGWETCWGLCMGLASCKMINFVDGPDIDKDLFDNENNLETKENKTG